MSPDLLVRCFDRHVTGSECDADEIVCTMPAGACATRCNGITECLLPHDEYLCGNYLNIADEGIVGEG